MRKALIVSYNFPPVGGAGVQRPVKFVKYLREFGWEPVVLSVANPSVPVLDLSLLRDIPDGVRVYRAATLEPGYALKSRIVQGEGGVAARAARLAKRWVAALLLPDLQVLWWPALCLKLWEILRTERPEVLLVSAPPFSSFVPVAALGYLARVPVILDYRDEWCFTRQNWENSVKSRWAVKLDRLLEGWVLSRCRAFVTANESYREAIASSYPAIGPQKGRTITNGFDEDDLAAVAPSTVPQRGGIRIVYAGTVWRATSLATFLKGLEIRQLKGAGASGPPLSLDIFGRVVEEESRCLAESPCRGMISVLGYREHGELIGELMDADVLLLTLADLPGAERIITGKAFEYMATGRHILAVVPEGETGRLLRENYRNLTLVTTGSAAEVADALERIASSLEELRKRGSEDVSRFSRRKLTAALAELFDEVAAGEGP
ncbi:glycosyltransferase [Geomonas sp. Red32]|uniref:glycosyltransferase n=1 Tax=Geomonas sp. Red32 TaxID=2912856 RepID=UPI00202CD75F|nr:glycosyltransferase [Geomonas sp. Red32]MCM0083346.1 glycosyltransferase [Geomonas sp. Red32]